MSQHPKQPHQPLISVIIPTNNEEGRIALALESMCNQTYKNLEILVIDDHSTDNTKEIVEKISKKDPRVRYHLLPYEDKKRKNWRGYDINGGYLARNYGFKIAKGEYMVLQDADDASFLNRIEAQYNLAKKYNAHLVAIQWQQLKDETINKQLDVDQIFKDKGEDAIIIRPDYITNLARENKGLLMGKWFPHRFTPFIFKWCPITRPLFFKRFDTYPGADNSVLFRREVVEKVPFRKRDDRVWPAPSGRGSGRDFTFQVAETFKNSWSFKLPLYLWRATTPNPNFAGYEKYVK